MISVVRRRHPLLLYAIRRLIAAVGLLFVVSILIYAATSVLPGDAAQQLAGRFASPEIVKLYRHQLGLDKPLTQRYFEWIGGLVRGDLGTSIVSHERISVLIGQPLKNTLMLGAVASVVALAFAFLLGIVSGIREGSRVDQAIAWVSLASISMPDFVVATALAYVIGIVLAWFPPVSILEPGQSPLAHLNLLVLPITTIVIVGVAYSLRMIRAGVIDVMRSEYVQMARLNGIRERRVVFDHTLRNALAPAAQVIAYLFMWLLGGVIIVETVFAYPGIGYAFYQAILARDVPYVLDVAMLIGGMYIVLNIAADLAVILLVPKLRTRPQ